MGVGVWMGGWADGGGWGGVFGLFSRLCLGDLISEEIDAVSLPSLVRGGGL